MHFMSYIHSRHTQSHKFKENHIIIYFPLPHLSLFTCARGCVLVWVWVCVCRLFGYKTHDVYIFICTNTIRFSAATKEDIYIYNRRMRRKTQSTQRTRARFVSVCTAWEQRHDLKIPTHLASSKEIYSTHKHTLSTGKTKTALFMLKWKFIPYFHTYITTYI